MILVIRIDEDLEAELARWRLRVDVREDQAQALVCDGEGTRNT